MIEAFLNFFRLPKSTKETVEPRNFRIIVFGTEEEVFSKNLNNCWRLPVIPQIGTIIQLVYEGNIHLFIVKSCYLDYTDTVYDKPTDIAIVKVQKVS